MRRLEKTGSKAAGVACHIAERLKRQMLVLGQITEERVIRKYEYGKVQ